MILTEKIQSPLVTARPSHPALVTSEADEALLYAAREMNREALVRIFDLYSTPLYNYALRLCQDRLAADHIVGDVFARFLEQLSAGHGPERNLRSYLYQTTYHLVVDEVRYSKRRVPLEALESRHYDEPASQSAEKQMSFEQIMHAIRTRLTGDQRHVIILRFLEGMSVRETAEIMGKREDHVKVIQNRAINALRNMLPA